MSREQRPDPPGSNTHSLNAFLYHPLATTVIPSPDGGGSVWTCATPMQVRAHLGITPNSCPPRNHAPHGQDGDAYQIRPKPAHTPARHASLIMRTYTWLNRRGVRIRGICMGVLDIDTRGIYLVDMVGERRGRVVLVVLYCSPGRAQVFSRFRWCAHDAH